MTEPTEMELRVAKAMFSACGTLSSWDDLDKEWAAVPGAADGIRGRFLERARAAIRAMRDWPTIPMTDAGVNAGGLARRSHAVTVWQAMIDAASQPRGGER